MGLRVTLAVLLCMTVAACTGWRNDASRGERDLGAASSNVRSAAPDPERGPSAGAQRVVSLALGEFHTCVLLGSGKVRCWGDRETPTAPVNLGQVETAAAAVPERLGAKALRISAGGDDSCAVLEDGRVRCWQLGFPNRVREASLAQRVTEISSGGWHSCALTVAGKVHCWGSGSYNQLGYGSRLATGVR